MRAGALLGLLLQAGEGAPAPTPPADVSAAQAALAGAWQQEQGAEHWLALRGGLVGAGYFFRDRAADPGGPPDAAMLELLAITPGPAGLRYHALPGCTRAATFDQEPAGELAFARTDGGFPTALRYSRAGPDLDVRLRGAGDRALDLRFAPAPKPSADPPARVRWGSTLRRWAGGVEVDGAAPAWPLPSADALWAKAPDPRYWLAADREGDVLRGFLLITDHEGGAWVICAARFTARP